MNSSSLLQQARFALRKPQVKIGVVFTIFGIFAKASGTWGLVHMLPLSLGGWFLGMGMLLVQQQRDAMKADRSEWGIHDPLNPRSGEQHTVACPFCNTLMEPGNLSVDAHRNGFDLLGWALPHCWFVPEEGDKELLVSNKYGLRATHPSSGSFREAHLCRTCHTAVAPGESTSPSGSVQLENPAARD